MCVDGYVEDKSSTKRGGGSFVVDGTRKPFVSKNIYMKKKDKQKSIN